MNRILKKPSPTNYFNGEAGLQHEVRRLSRDVFLHPAVSPLRASMLGNCPPDGQGRIRLELSLVIAASRYWWRLESKRCISSRCHCRLRNLRAEERSTRLNWLSGSFAKNGLSSATWLS